MQHQVSRDMRARIEGSSRRRPERAAGTDQPERRRERNVDRQTVTSKTLREGRSTHPSSLYRNDTRNDTGVRDDGAATCPLCQQPFVPRGRQQVCSAACRQALWRRRHPSAVASVMAAVPERVTGATTVYECPSCETRLLGVQRCADCGVFCRRIGPGGPCPHCDEPVALTDLFSP